MIIRVKQEHIDAGGRSGLSCPVALAIQEQLPDRSVYVGRVSLQFCGDTNWQPMPQEVRKWIAEYDMGMKVEPFEFEMNLG